MLYANTLFFKVLKHEEDLGILMTALMDLLVLIPIVPVYISPYLQDLFEIFSRVAAWRYVLKLFYCDR